MEFGPDTSICALVFSHSLTVGLTKLTAGRAFTVSVLAAVFVQVPIPAMTFTVYVPAALVMLDGTVNGLVFVIVWPFMFQSYVTPVCGVLMLMVPFWF